jgi:protein-S-isoprenylcysteine O-methyltransferase Ste14
MKAVLEERWLSAELDAGEYARYRERIPMLVPFGPRGS